MSIETRDLLAALPRLRRLAANGPDGVLIALDLIEDRLRAVPVVIVYRHPDSETNMSAHDCSPRFVVLDYGSTFDGTPDDRETAVEWLESIGWQLAGIPADHPARVETIEQAVACVLDAGDIGLTETEASAAIQRGEAEAVEAEAVLQQRMNP